jgi:hypothetical protein
MLRSKQKAYLSKLLEAKTFLNNYEDTPRSKLIKKYIPPLHPLVEDLEKESRASSTI